MKKGILIALLILAVSFLTYAYLITPSVSTASSVSKMDCPAGALVRMLRQPQYWSNWWPGAGPGDTADFRFQGLTFVAGKDLLNSREVLLPQFGPNTTGGIMALPETNDSCIVEWKTELRAGVNPFQRIANAFRAKRVQNATDSLLAAFGHFASQAKNVYGITVKQIKVTDTLLIATRFQVNDIPTVADIYQAIAKLEKYAAQQRARQVNPPMLNVEKRGSVYQVMVALPLDKELPNQGDILFKQMIPGKILVTEVKGGWQQVAESFRQLGNYVADHKLNSPAIPFESLVTDRRQEADSSRWITRLYYPIY